jgi:hypothetical protein
LGSPTATVPGSTVNFCTLGAHAFGRAESRSFTDEYNCNFWF